MSKRPRAPQANASASEDLVERLKAASNDVSLLREIIETNESGSVAAAFAALLAGDSSFAPSGSKLRKKAHNRRCPSLPAETFVEVVLFADRDTLDAMQLVCIFLLNFIREREVAHLALRAIAQIIIGSWEGPEDEHGWLPLVWMVRNYGAGKQLDPKSVHHLTFFLRMAFCRSMCIDLSGAPEEDRLSNAVCNMLFHDLSAPNTFVDMLTITKFHCNVEVLTRGIEAFKSVKTVIAEWEYDIADLTPLGEAFLVSAARHGVRRVEIRSSEDGGVTPANAAVALSFGFAEPTAGGDRALLGVNCEGGGELLALVKQKVAEMVDARNVDFHFKLADVVSHIASAGFEKYQIDAGRTWLINDLQNHINVEVKKTENLVEIHVFSSV